MKVTEILKQSFPFLLLCGIGEVLVGIMFGHSTVTLEMVPGLIVLIPALIGLRGNINTTLGSRLGSAVHMGLISPDDFWNDELKENVKSSITLSVSMAFLAGVLAYSTCIIVGKSSVSFLIIIAIAVISGTIAGLTLALITVLIIIYAFKRGLDPDNITGPSLATIGDMITLFCILGAAVLIGGA
jgi:mgtE-like transporter